MRMPLTPLLILMAASGLAVPLHPAELGGIAVQGTLQGGYYNDNAGVSVASPSADLRVAPDPRTALTLRYDVDAVSAASFDYARSKTHANGLHAAGACNSCHSSVDALSGASRNYIEQRQAVTFGAERRIGESKASVSYYHGDEHDYRSDAVSLGWSQAMAHRDSTLDLEVHHRSDLVGASWDPTFQKPRYAIGAALGYTQVLTPDSQLKAVLDYEDTQGYLADPYAFVQVWLYDSLPYSASAPGKRQRWDLDLAFKQALPWDGAAAEADYRYYADTWDVAAHSVALSLSQELAGWVLEPEARFYTQTKASFFQNHYQEVQGWMTRDLKLAAFQTYLLGLSLRGPLWNALEAELRYTHFVRVDQLDYSLYFADGPVAADTVQLGITLR